VNLHSEHSVERLVGRGIGNKRRLAGTPTKTYSVETEAATALECAVEVINKRKAHHASSRYQGTAGRRRPFRTPHPALEPKMKPYIFEARNGIYVIDLEYSVKQLETARISCARSPPAARRCFSSAARSRPRKPSRTWPGAAIPFTSPSAGWRHHDQPRHDPQERRAHEADRRHGSQRHDGQDAEAGSFRDARENAKLHRNLDGIKDMEKYPAAIVIVDVSREKSPWPRRAG